MRHLLVLIPTRTDALLLRLFASFDRTEPGWRSDPRVKMGVLDNGLKQIVFAEDVWPAGLTTLFGESRTQPWQRIRVPDPFNFSLAVNLGLRRRGNACGVLLLNDDVEMVKPGWIGACIHYAHASPRTLMGVTVEHGVVGNDDQRAENVDATPGLLHGLTPLEQYAAAALVPTHRTICFLGALFTPDVLAEIGELDERFNAYGWEDNDYSRRVQEAGMALGVMRLVRVNHGLDARGMNTTFLQTRTPQEMRALFLKGRDIYLDKWGSSLT